MIYDRYLELCNKKDKSPSGAAIEMGFSKTTVNRWKHGGGVTDATAKKIADYFGVPVEELTGQKEPPPAETEAENPAKRELLEIIRRLSPAKIAVMLDKAKELEKF